MSDSQKWLLLVITGLIGAVFYFLAPILMPFVAGTLLAYMGNPFVCRLTRWKIPRVLAVIFVFFAITLFFLGLIGILIPEIRDQIQYLNTRMPDFANWINNQVFPTIQQFFDVDLQHLDITSLTDALASSWQEAGSFAGQLITKIAASGLNIAITVASLALIPVVTFYLMLDWDLLLQNISELLPRQYLTAVTKLAKECDEVLGAFFRGQLLVMLCLSIVYAVGLKIVGLDIAVIVGLTAGLGSIIPYFGFTIGIVLATIAAIFQFQEWLPLLWVWTVFGVGQIIEGWVLVPYLVGNKVGLHPVAVIFAIMAGGQLFGFFGMLLAIPATAVIVVLMRFIRRHYLESELYQQPKEPG